MGIPEMQKDAVALSKRFKKTSPRQEMTRDEWLKFLNHPRNIDAGEVKLSARVKAETKDYLKKEKNAVFKTEEVEIPRWLRGYISNKKSSVETVNYLLERLAKAPDKKGLLLVSALINDLSNKKDGGVMTSKILTQETVNKFIELSNSIK